MRQHIDAKIEISIAVNGDLLVKMQLISIYSALTFTSHVFC